VAGCLRRQDPHGSLDPADKPRDDVILVI